MHAIGGLCGFCGTHGLWLLSLCSADDGIGIRCSSAASQRNNSGDCLLPVFLFDPGGTHAHPVRCVICQDLSTIGEVSALVSAFPVCDISHNRAIQINSMSEGYHVPRD